MLFLCAGNNARMGGVLDEGNGTSIRGYDFSETALHVGDLARKKGKGPMFLGIFYDPAVPINIDEDLEFVEMLKAAKEKSRKLLRLQATDFVAWLKRQGGV